MRLYLVEESTEQLIALAERVEAFSEDFFAQLPIEISLLREDYSFQVIGAMGGGLVLIGPGRESNAAELGHQIRSANLAVILLLSRASYDKKLFHPIASKDFFSILPDDVSSAELEAALTAAGSEIVKSTAARHNVEENKGHLSRYEIVRELGSGSYGVVYLCRHRELSGVLVAMKMLHPELAKDSGAITRFREEIYASFGVSHPNVVRFFEYMREPNSTMCTMEYIDGGDLSQIMTQKIPIPETLRILSQACAGVQAIHDAGIIHRNLKPENILLTKAGEVKIADFCCSIRETHPRTQPDGMVSGSIDYASPEYLLYSQIDRRCDIYALGAIGYEMLTNQAPFCGSSVYETMTKRIKSEPPPVSSLCWDCPSELDTAILTALKGDPAERFQSAAELFNVLQPLRGTEAEPLMKLPGS